MRLLIRPLRAALFVLLTSLLAACNLTAGQVGDGVNTPLPSARPAVTINSPANGSAVALGQQILVSATATDSVGVSRVQLLANGVVVKTINSESASGDRTLNALLDFRPQVAGQLQLQVIAYRGSTASLPVGITVTVGQATPAPTTARTATSGPPPLITNQPPINPNDPTCRVLTNANVNLRQGPDANIYPVITLLNAGTVAPVTGRIGSNQWYQVRVGVTLGWVSAGFVTLYGTLCSTVPVVPVPPTPTPIGGGVTIVAPTVPPTATPIPPTQPPPPPTVTPGLADLIITGVSAPPTLTLGPGGTPVAASIAVTITNTSGRPTGQFSSTITITPGGTAQPLGVVGNLNPGESVVLTYSFSFATAGTYTIQAQADSSANVTEASEVNNIGFASIIITAP